jgi:hypothetical protein
MMAMSSKEKLRRLGDSRFINIDINKLIIEVGLSNKLSSSTNANDSIKISGVMRFKVLNDSSIKVPSYKMLLLVGNNVYYYRKISRNGRSVNFDEYDGVIEFNSSDELEEYWSKYIKNEIINIKTL